MSSGRPIFPGGKKWFPGSEKGGVSLISERKPTGAAGAKAREPDAGRCLRAGGLQVAALQG